VIPGLQVSGFGAAMIATVVTAAVNATIGWVLRLISLPLIFLTLGLFLLVINALLLDVRSRVYTGFAGSWRPS
jgi:putative membrane protein